MGSSELDRFIYGFFITSWTPEAANGESNPYDHFFRLEAAPIRVILLLQSGPLSQLRQPDKSRRPLQKMKEIHV
jgi:hypothetical protein